MSLQTRLSALITAVGADIKALNTAIAGKQASDPTLTALASLVGAADRLPYFNGADAATLATFTAFARQLLDDADAATARGTLGTDAAGASRPPTAHGHPQSDITNLVADLVALEAINARVVQANLAHVSSGTFPTWAALTMGTGRQLWVFSLSGYNPSGGVVVGAKMQHGLNGGTLADVAGGRVDIAISEANSHKAFPTGFIRTNYAAGTTVTGRLINAVNLATDANARVNVLLVELP